MLFMLVDTSGVPSSLLASVRGRAAGTRHALHTFPFGLKQMPASLTQGKRNSFSTQFILSFFIVNVPPHAEYCQH